MVSYDEFVITSSVVAYSDKGEKTSPYKIKNITNKTGYYQPDSSDFSRSDSTDSYGSNRSNNFNKNGCVFNAN